MGSFRSRNGRDGITSRFRLRGYDYATPGYYFLTMCIQNRAHLLGTVTECLFIPSAAGMMVDLMWCHQAERFPGIELGEFCVMPNHFHALIGLGTSDEQGGGPVSLPSIVQGFKAATTVEYAKGVREWGWEPFEKRLWQKGYHDHIVRDERELARIRAYIEANSAKWPEDTFFS